VPASSRGDHWSKRKSRTSPQSNRPRKGSPPAVAWPFSLQPMLALTPCWHGSHRHIRLESIRRRPHGRGRPYRENRKGPPSHPTTGGGEVSPSLMPRADHSRRLPWRPSLPAPVLPRLATRREMGTPETPSRVYTWGGVIDINGVTRSHHQEKRSDGVSTRQKPHGTCTRGMDFLAIDPSSRAQLPETPPRVYTR
jgi:hypothetical protein